MKTTTLSLLGICLIFLVSCQSGQLPGQKISSDAPQELQTKFVEQTIGIDVDLYAFSWKNSAEISQQKAYQIIVASDKAKLAAGIGDLWDSGKRASSQHEDIIYRGQELAQGKEYFWKVKVWDQANTSLGYSQAASFTSASSGKENRIILLGGSLVSRMEKYAFFETALNAEYPYQNLVFRNLGWPGDDVEGTARSEFGSAHNTKSWKPPTSEQGFGYAEMKNQVIEANPSTVIFAYGAEMAFKDASDDFDAFKRNYRNLLRVIDSLGAKLILLSPNPHEAFAHTEKEIEKRNERLAKARDFIQEEARKANYPFIDLFAYFNKRQMGGSFTENGIHLSESAYADMAMLMLQNLGINAQESFQLEMDEQGKVQASSGLSINDFTPTATGYRFDIKSDKLSPYANLKVDREHLVKVDGEVVRERELDERLFIKPQKAQWEKLRSTIIEKNRLQRLRLNPLNKAYIFLFRRHEMGHLSKEMEDFDRLVQEQEELITRLKIPQEHRLEVEILEAWKSPQEYKEYYVPKEVPMPDVSEELAAFTIPEGFEINLFAKDPWIVNPINLNWDNQGRAWVASSSTYPQIFPGREPNDRIVILEDTDQDGVADKHTVFAEGLVVPHSVMPVKGGAYLCNTSEVWFYADKDGDDVADEKRLVYSGFGIADMHHTIHGFRWAPWGDLYFTQSIYINSFIETAFGSRRLNGSGIWEFRPETERLEVFSTGMVNPWGQAFDQWGQAFGTDGAGGSGPHYLFPGAAHNTAVGAARVLPGLIPGKPKNTAAEVVYSEQMPEGWQGSLLANDYRANRTVRYQLTESGSGYSAEEVETVIHSSHRSYRPVDIKTGPDGAIYIIDWYNPIIAHGEVDFHHPMRDKSHGRIWRLTRKGNSSKPFPQIKGVGVAHLLDSLKSNSQLTRLMANRELVEQGLRADKLMFWVMRQDKKHPRYEHHLLEALWLHAAINVPHKKLIDRLLDAKDHHIRAAATRMLGHWKEEIEGMDLLAKVIRDEHPQVRLEAVHVLREMGNFAAVEMAMQAVDLPMDENLDFALWNTAREGEAYWLPKLKNGDRIFEGKADRMGFALSASGDKDAMKSLLPLVQEGKIKGEEAKNILLMLAGNGGQEEIDWLFEKAMQEKDQELLAGLSNSTEIVPRDANKLTELLGSKKPEERILGLDLAGTWKVKEMKDKVAGIASNPALDPAERHTASMALMAMGEIDEVIKQARGGKNLGVRATSAAAWASEKPGEAAMINASILGQIGSVDYAELLIGAYMNREEGPDILAQALKAKKLDPRIAAKGVSMVQSSGRDLQKLLGVLEAALPIENKKANPVLAKRSAFLASVEKEGNASKGAQIYKRPSLLCSTCHKLNGQGGKLGPDLSTLGTFSPTSGILESLLNPSDNIKQGYETVVLTRKDGTTVSGTLQRRSDTGAVIMDANNKIINVPNEEIAKLFISPISMMPAGLTNSLSEEELRDLLKYLSQLGK
ncbi:MAG: HEAT repeat domain-containing protein [Bacteroidia bacterium]|nr:HEAT repeat domain-containing protein [Bacteroidia bacterium]